MNCGKSGPNSWRGELAGGFRGVSASRRKEVPKVGHAKSCPLTRRPKDRLLPSPVGHEVVAHVGQLVLFGAVGKHGPDLGVSADLAFKDDVTAVGGPAWKVVAARIMGELEPA